MLVVDPTDLFGPTYGWLTERCTMNVNLNVSTRCASVCGTWFFRCVFFGAPLFRYFSLGEEMGPADRRSNKETGRIPDGQSIRRVTV